MVRVVACIVGLRRGKEVEERGVGGGWKRQDGGGAGEEQMARHGQVHMHGGIYFEKVGGGFGGSETQSLKEGDGTVLIRVGGTGSDEMDEQGMGVRLYQGPDHSSTDMGASRVGY